MQEQGSSVKLPCHYKTSVNKNFILEWRFAPISTAPEMGKQVRDRGQGLEPWDMGVAPEVVSKVFFLPAQDKPDGGNSKLCQGGKEMMKEVSEVYSSPLNCWFACNIIGQQEQARGTFSSALVNIF